MCRSRRRATAAKSGARLKSADPVDLPVSAQMTGKIVLVDGKGREATVTIADVDQSNGVIHVIDTVLLPS